LGQLCGFCRAKVLPTVVLNSFSLSLDQLYSSVIREVNCVPMVAVH